MGLLDLSQHSFLPKRSCVSDLLGFPDNVTQLVDLRNDVDVIYLDFQKAFDKVPLSRLMLKAKSLGVQGSIADWIRAWLSNRWSLMATCLPGSVFQVGFPRALF